jgi:formamidopyrimidine-DNA glycosylase
VVAGLGNIYADEALFVSGVRPETLCTELQLEQIERLRTAIIQVLEASIAAGGTTFSNFLNVQGVNGDYGGVAQVYNRAAEPCRICDTPIQRIRLAGRSAHFVLNASNNWIFTCFNPHTKITHKTDINYTVLKLYLNPVKELPCNTIN